MNDLQKMNMQKTIDNIVNEFRQKLENELTRPSNALGFIPDSARATRRALIPEI